MTKIDVRFKLNGKKFGVEQQGKGVHPNLRLFQYDGKRWNLLDTASVKQAHKKISGEEKYKKLNDEQLLEWGKSLAEWYAE